MQKFGKKAKIVSAVVVAGVILLAPKLLVESPEAFVVRMNEDISAKSKRCHELDSTIDNTPYIAVSNKIFAKRLVREAKYNIERSFSELDILNYNVEHPAPATSDDDGLHILFRFIGEHFTGKVDPLHEVRIADNLNQVNYCLNSAKLVAFTFEDLKYSI